MQLLLYPLVIVLVLLADQLSKLWILANFALGEVREIISGFFNLVYVTNPGAAFSMLADVQGPWRHWFFLGIGCLALIALTWMAISSARNSAAGFVRPSLYIVAFGLIAGGALGNLIDRIRYGAVVDFLDFYLKNYHWPAFNIADTAICLGAGLFLLVSILENTNQQRREM